MRRIPAPDFASGDGLYNDGAGGDNRIVADGHAFADHAVGADEDMVANHDGRGLDVVAVFVAAGANGRVGGVEVGVEDLHTAADHHVVSDRHRAVRDDRGVRHAHVAADRQHSLWPDQDSAAEVANLGVGLAGPDVEMIADRRLAAEGDVDSRPAQCLQATAFHAIEPEEHACVGGPVRGREALVDGFAGFEDPCGHPVAARR